uniref:Uncharacterized protein n=1 Tax=Leersia perrieri TaxID=77586 RepID=A0A0D9XC39_9ORYZ
MAGSGSPWPEQKRGTADSRGAIQRRLYGLLQRSSLSAASSCKVSSGGGRVAWALLIAVLPWLHIGLVGRKLQ